MLRLTDEEIGNSWPSVMSWLAGERDRKVAQVQLKKVYDWGNEPCYEHLLGGLPIKRHACIHCWQSLLEVK